MARGRGGASGDWLLAAVPALFVLLWSTGFIGAKLGVPYASPLLFLAVRFAVTALLLFAWVALRGEVWPRGWRLYADLAVVGTLLHTIYLGGVFVAISWGLEAGTSALIVSLQPVLVAALAGAFLGERVTRLQWLGLVLGMAGVALVVWRKAGLSAQGLDAALLCLLSLCAITGAILYQKRRLGAMPPISGNAMQFAFAAVSCTIAVLLFEPDAYIVWSPSFIIALAWLVLALSIGAVGLFLLMVRRGAASKVSSLFFLVPPCTAVIAWAFFGEVLGWVELLGMAIAGLGVALVNRR